MIRRTRLQLLSLEARDVPAAVLFALPGLNEVAGLDVLADGTIQVVGQGPPTETIQNGRGVFLELASDGTLLRTATFIGSSSSLSPEEVALDAVHEGRVVGVDLYHLPGGVAIRPAVWDSSAPEEVIYPDDEINVGDVTDINRNGTIVGWSGGNDNFPTALNWPSARVGTFGQTWATLDGPWSETTPFFDSYAWGISDDNIVVLSAHARPPVFFPTSIQSWVYNIDTDVEVSLPNPVATPDVDFVSAVSISPNGRFVGGGAGVFDPIDSELILNQLVLFSGANWQIAEPVRLPDGRPFFSQTDAQNVFLEVVVADDGMLFSNHYGDAFAWVKVPGLPVMTLNDYVVTTGQLVTDLVFREVTDVVTRNRRHYLSVNTDQGARILVIDALNLNTPPTTSGLTPAMDEDTALDLDLLAGATDADGDVLSIVAVGSPAHGKITWAADGTATYRPDADYNGPDSFTYTVTDGTASVVGRVTVTVRPVDEPPIVPPPPRNPPPVSRWLTVPGAADAIAVTDASTGVEVYSRTPFGAPGTAVAADFTGDGAPDLLAGAGPGAGPHVKLIDGATGAELFSFFAFDEAFLGGVNVATADIDGDGRLDLIVAAGPGAGPHVKVFSGATGAELRSFFAFDPSFAGGVNVAGGDFDGDGFGDIIVGAGPGAGPHVKAFSGRTGSELASFFAYDQSFYGGVSVAAGDFDRDGRADIIVGAGPGAGPHVRVFVGTTLFAEAIVGDPISTRGVGVAGRDANGDGIVDLIATIPTQTQPEIFVFDSETVRDRRMEPRRLR